MIPSNRKVGKELFKTLLKSGRTCQSESFFVRTSLNSKLPDSKFSVVVSKKIEKTAVGRNFFKRTLYSILASFLKRVKNGTVCVFFVKKNIIGRNRLQLETETSNVLKKLSLLR